MFAKKGENKDRVANAERFVSPESMVIKCWIRCLINIAGDLYSNPAFRFPYRRRGILATISIDFLTPLIKRSQSRLFRQFRQGDYMKVAM